MRTWLAAAYISGHQMGNETFRAAGAPGSMEFLARKLTERTNYRLAKREHNGEKLRANKLPESSSPPSMRYSTSTCTIRSWLPEEADSAQIVAVQKQVAESGATPC